MRATPEIGMNVVLKSQERSPNPVVMQIEALPTKDTASVIGFNANNHPFKIDVNLANLEKVNLNRLNSMKG